ncbi:MAG: fibronectin type III domain-containing protein [Nitrospirota bacterium]
MKKLTLYGSMFVIFFFLVSCGAGGGGGTVSTPTTGIATLNWTAPSSSGDITGYKIYYGTTSGNYTNTADARLATSYIFRNLARGYTYYFVVRAYNKDGVESNPSNEKSKTI